MSGTVISVNPATGKEIATYKIDDAKKIAGSLKSAEKAYNSWRGTTFKERAVVLKRIAATIRKNKEKLAHLATKEMGKPIEQSFLEVEKCAMNMEYYAKHGAAMLADEIVKTEASKSYISYQPLGVVLAIMPWNFPYWQVFRAMGPILMAGNAMVLKHASNVSGCAKAIEKILKDADVPAGLFHTLLIPGAEVEPVIKHPVIAAVTLTGSTAAGKKVASVAAAHIKKQVLELGGSDAYIVLKDADMKLAVDTCVKGRLYNSGQSCVCAKRFIVDKSVRKEFEEKMTEQMKASTFGDPMDKGNRIGPLARVDLRDELHQQVMDSIKKGAKLLCGGYIPEGDGAYYPPTVLTSVKKGMPAYDEELFGPVAAIIEAKDEEHAIMLANDSIYGLGSGIFSKNVRKAEKIAATKIQAGNCFVNAFVHSDPRLPFGGTKQSGYGRELSYYGIREFTNIKTVFVG